MYSLTHSLTVLQVAALAVDSHISRRNFDNVYTLGTLEALDLTFLRPKMIFLRLFFPLDIPGFTQSLSAYYDEYPIGLNSSMVTDVHTYSRMYDDADSSESEVENKVKNYDASRNTVSVVLNTNLESSINKRKDIILHRCGITLLLALY